MNHGEFRNLLVAHGWQDRWWISIDGELSPQVVSIDDAFAKKTQNPAAAILLINEAENRDTSLWQVLDLEPTPAPTTSPQPMPNLLAQEPDSRPAAPSPFSIQNVAAAHQQISLGIMLLLISWAIKQALTSFAIFGLGGAMAMPALEAKIMAKSASESADLQEELSELSASGSTDSGRMGKLQTEIREAREKVREDYQDDRQKASVKTAKGTSTALGATRNFFRWKLLLDIIKIGALVLMALGALKLVRDDETSLANRALGISLTIVIVFSVLVSGLVSMLS